MNRVTPGTMFLLVAAVGLTACVTPQPPPPETEGTVIQTTGTSEPTSGERHSADEEGGTNLRNETETGSGMDVDVDTGAHSEGAVDVDVDSTTDADTDASGVDETGTDVGGWSTTCTTGTSSGDPPVDPREVIQLDKTRGYKEPQEPPVSDNSKPEAKPKPPAH